MKAVILAAGYGTRLQRDVATETSGRFAHLVGTAKPLLPVGGRALISHWVNSLTASACVDCIYVVTNGLYCAAFEKWATQFTNVKVLSDHTTTNEGRLGAVACLQFTVKHFNIQDHILVIGGDTLFKEDFSLLQVSQKFTDLQKKCDESCLVLSYCCRDEETQKYGILEVDAELRVTCMKEKPSASETTSRRACPCFYIFSKKSLPLLDSFMNEKQEAPIQEKDAPGNFLSWLISRRPVYIHEISGRFDVGNLKSYVDCDLYFSEKLQDLSSYMV